MELVTAEQRRQLIDNWNLEDDIKLVVKIFSPVGAATWIIASMNPQDEDTLYGLCDLGLGYPEPGYVRLNELQSMTVRVSAASSAGIGLERDLYFKPNHSLSTYAEAAQQNGAITDDPKLLDAAQDCQ